MEAIHLVRDDQELGHIAQVNVRRTFGPLLEQQVASANTAGVEKLIPKIEMFRTKGLRQQCDFADS